MGPKINQENLLIEGNNLIALSSLLSVYGGGVKLIYIDPPYNTGGHGDLFTYNNSFKHSTWLMFMKNRLDVARSLLSSDGFICIAIDHFEILYLGLLADEVFGRENRIGMVTVVHKPEGRSQQKFFGVSNEYMLVYAKDQSRAKFNKVTITDSVRQRFDKVDESGNYKLRSFIRGEGLRTSKPHLFYPIYVGPHLDEFSLDPRDNYKKVLPISGEKERHWFLKPQSFIDKVQKGEIVAKHKRDASIEICYKVYEVEVIKTHWIGKKYNASTYGTNLLNKTLGRTKAFSYPKSLHLVKDVVKITTSEDDTILDFFAGSGTTGHAVLMQNKEDGGSRRFILIEQLNEHIKVCQERLQRVIKSENIDDSFVSVELAKFNQTFVDEIDSARSLTDLTQIWKNMQTEAFLQYTVKCSQVESSLLDESLGIEFKKQLLREVLDANQLYISKSEMDDVKYGISQRNKILTTRFYNGPEDQPRKFVN